MRAKLTALGFLVAAIVTFNSSPAYAQGGATPPYGAGYFQVLNDNTTYPCGVGAPGVTVTDQITGALNQSVFGGGGASDWTCYGQPITITKDVFSPISANILVWGGEHAITVNANATIPSNFEICFGPGGSIAAGVGFTLTNHATSCLGGGGGGGSCPGTATPTQILYDDGGNCAGIPTSEVDVPDTEVSWQYYFYFGTPFSSFSPFMTDFGGPGDNTVASLNGPESTALSVLNQVDGSVGVGELVENLNSGTGDFPGVGIEVYSLFSATAGAKGALISASAVGTGAGSVIGLEVQTLNEGSGALNQSIAIATDDVAATITPAEAISFFGGTGLYEFGDWTEPGTDTFADLTAEAAGLPGGGFTKNCSDCDTPAYAGAACTASVDNAGAQAIYIQGGLYCYGKVTGGGGGGTPGGIPTNLQYNLGGSFAGVAGSTVDTSGDVAIAPTAATATALTVTAATAQNAANFESTGDEPLGTLFVNSFSSAQAGSFGLNAGSASTDNTGASVNSYGAAFSSQSVGSDTTGDTVAAVTAGYFFGGTGGSPAYGAGVSIVAPSNTLIGVLQFGLDIFDQAQGNPATGVNAAIRIQNQTLTGLPEPYAIKGGTGWYFFGDFVSPGTDTLAGLGSQIIASPTSGVWQKGCSDCDTPTVEGATCTASGDHAGALAIFLRGIFLCF